MPEDWHKATAMTLISTDIWPMDELPDKEVQQARQNEDVYRRTQEAIQQAAGLCVCLAGSTARTTRIATLSQTPETEKP